MVPLPGLFVVLARSANVRFMQGVEVYGPLTIGIEGKEGRASCTISLRGTLDLELEGLIESTRASVCLLARPGDVESLEFRDPGENAPEASDILQCVVSLGYSKPPLFITDRWQDRCDTEGRRDGGREPQGQVFDPCSG